jgi:UDP-glucose 4-epimerase
VVAIFSQLMLSGGQPVIFGDGTKTRDYVHVSDVIAALRLGIENGSGCIYNVGTGIETSDREVFDAIAETVGFREQPHFTDYRAGEVYRIALDAGRLRREHGWTPKYDFRAGIRATVPWYRERVKAGA